MLIEKEQIVAAVKALKAVAEKQKKKKSNLLVVEEVQLQFTLKKVPKFKNKIIKLKLPHVVARESTDVCLFVKDVHRKDKEYQATVIHFKQLLDRAGVDLPVEVIPLRALKTEYKPYEAKKNLSNQFDVYLGDERIVRLLPALLGKHFYGRKRHPIQVNLGAKDLKTEIKQAATSSRCILGGQGPTSTCVVAHYQMPEQEIVENIADATSIIAESIPGGQDNIRNFYIKTPNSMAIPLFISLGSSINVDLPMQTEQEPDSVVGQITTMMKGKVEITSKGEVHIIKRSKAHLKKRMKYVKKSRNKHAKMVHASKTWISKERVKKSK